MRKLLSIISIFLLTSCFEDTPKIESDVTKVHFNETAKKEILQDIYQARLSYKTSGSDITKLQNEINEKIKAAIKTAKANNDLEISTGHYSSYQGWNKEKTRKWNASQEVIIKSENKEALLKTVAKIQAMSFNMNSLTAFLSEKAITKHKNNLINEALERVKNRAKSIAKNLNKDEVEIAEIRVNSNQNHYRSSRFTSLRSESKRSTGAITPPSVEPGKQEISVSISVIAHIKD